MTSDPSEWVICQVAGHLSEDSNEKTAVSHRQLIGFTVFSSSAESLLQRPAPKNYVFKNHNYSICELKKCCRMEQQTMIKTP